MAPLLYWLASLPIWSLLTDPSIPSSSPSRGGPWLLDLVWCQLSFTSNLINARCRSLSWATAWGLFNHCHFRNLSNGPTRVKGILLMKLVWTPSIKWMIVIVSTSRKQREGWYCNFSSIRNSCLDLWWQLTLIAKFQRGHHSARIAQNTTARK